jgi:hypothetical protein
MCSFIRKPMKFICASSKVWIQNRIDLVVMMYTIYSKFNRDSLDIFGDDTCWRTGNNLGDQPPRYAHICALSANNRQTVDCY